ncbi:hypothetical protein VTK56DRAFT_1778 [Thermocarpiscus australiensis]
MTDSLSYLICTACGTQHPTSDPTALTTCFICDDPRQFTPPTGQSFTTLAALRQANQHRNEFHPFPSGDLRFTSIVTEPRFAIGQRAILVRTPAGNVLWDCVSYLDDATAERIARAGGIQAIVVSHPHFYATHLEWAERFDCPVYLAAEDRQWLARRDPKRQVFLERTETRIEVGGRDTGVRVVKLGGHFPGSLVLLFDGHLLTADTLMMTAAGRSNWSVDALGRPRERPKGVNTFSFMWSIPNMIPLSADEIVRMWSILRHYDFRSAHGLILGFDIEDDNLKARVLESMQIQIRAMGYWEHPFLKEGL